MSAPKYIKIDRTMSPDSRCLLIIWDFLKLIIDKLLKTNIIFCASCLAAYLFNRSYLIVPITFAYFVLAFYHLQDVLVFCPVIPINSRIVIDKPSAVGLNFEETYEPKFGPLKLHLYLMLQPDSKSCCTIIFFHGNAGNIGHRLENAKGMYHTLKANILLVEYRGFGKSNGTPSESGLYCDADIAIHYLLERTDIDREKIIIFGRSIGGAVAIHFLAHSKYKSNILAAIIENTFTSIPNVCESRLKCIKYFPNFIYKNKFMSIKKVRRILTPILFICGEKDKLILPSMSRQLYLACSSPHKRLVEVRDGTHNGTWTCNGYYDILKEFLKNVPSGVPPLKSTLIDI